MTTRGDFYFREVVLLMDGSDKPVEFGANQDQPRSFPADARRHDFGRAPAAWQDSEGLPNFSHPSQAKAFFRVEPDDFISKVLGLNERASALRTAHNDL